MTSRSIHIRSSGNARVVGSLVLQGSKNAMLNNLCLPIATNETCIFSNVPDILDVRRNLELLASFGASVYWRERNTVAISCANLRQVELSQAQSEQTTGSKYFIPLMVSRFGEFITGPSGGDKIGDRGFSSYARALRQFGIDFELVGDKRYRFFQHGVPHENSTLAFPSFGLTINAIYSLIGKRGRFRISNCCQEAEIDNTLEILNSMGCHVKRSNSDICLELDGQPLRGGIFRNQSDRNAAVTFSAAAIMSRGRVEITNYDNLKMEAFYKLLSEWNVEVSFPSSRAIVVDARAAEISAAHIRAFLYPDFHSDWQPLVGPILCGAKGTSSIEEELFPDRLGYWDELGKMGAVFQYDHVHENRFADNLNHRVVVHGPAKLFGSTVAARDLRGAASLIIASLAAPGETTILNGGEIERGYEDVIDQIQSLVRPSEFSISWN